MRSIMKLSQKSVDKLNTCHPDLITLITELSKIISITVICGHRDKEAQEAAVKGGFSKLQFPKSKHNKLPSLAVDVAPLNTFGKISWNNVSEFERMLEVVVSIAKKNNIKIRLGRDFKSFKDYPHIELV